MSEAEYEAAVAAFLSTKGVTRCPTVCVVPTQATIPEADRAAYRDYVAAREAARLEKMCEERQQAELAAARRSQVGTGERAEKIRTYNFPENRLTDHRIKLTVHQLDRVLQGDLDGFTDALTAEDRRRALEDGA